MYALRISRGILSASNSFRHPFSRYEKRTFRRCLPLSTQKHPHYIDFLMCYPYNYSILQKIAYRFVDYCAMGYVRVPHEISEFVLDFSHGDYADDEANHNLDDTDAKLVALRRKMGDNLWSITIMLVNDRKESPVKANRCIFQAKIKISSENNDFIFVERNCVNLTLRFPIYPPFHTSSHPQSLHQPHKSSQLLLRHRPQPDGKDGDGFLPQPVILPGGQVQPE